MGTVIHLLIAAKTSSRGLAILAVYLVVVIGVLGGAILFGPVGLLLAIPTITVGKVFISSTARQLKAYGLM